MRFLFVLAAAVTSGVVEATPDTCASVKNSYSSNTCCGNPTKVMGQGSYYANENGVHNNDCSLPVLVHCTLYMAENTPMEVYLNATKATQQRLMFGQLVKAGETPLMSTARAFCTMASAVRARTTSLR